MIENDENGWVFLWFDKLANEKRAEKNVLLSFPMNNNSFDIISNEIEEDFSIETSNKKNI